MNLIVAVDQKFGIGKEGGLLTHLPEDLKRFKRMTKNNILIMGRKTIESLPGQKLLPERETWILTKDVNYRKDGAFIFHSIDAIFDHIELNNIDSDRVFVAGGAMVYNELLPFCRTAYVTKIDYDFEADVTMLNLDRQPTFYIHHVDTPIIQGSFTYTYIEYRQIV